MQTYDNAAHPADVIDVRTDANGLPQYYVHYLDCDRRLDEWVTVDRINPVAGTSGHIDRTNSTPGDLGGDRKVTRHLKRKIEETYHMPAHVDEHGGKEGGHGGGGHDRDHPVKVKNIQVVELGRWEMDTWYYAPYPEPYASQARLYICEFSLKYFRKKRTLLRHLAKLDARHPPGDEIYRSPSPSAAGSAASGAVTDPPISVFEVDGKKAKVYCQNLCLLSKLFLDHKTLYYDVDPFLFYVLCERDAEGYHLVGYFSKEKLSQEDHNLACILTLPAYQRKGYGKFLIAFSYELSKREGRPGTPERPLSDLGQVSFRSYWTRVLLAELRHVKGEVSLEELSRATMVMKPDIVAALNHLDMIKYTKSAGHYVLADPAKTEEQLVKYERQRYIEVEPSCLHWQPLYTAAVKRPK